MISVRWRPSSWMQFSSFFLKSSMTRANNWWSIGRISWRMASFKSFSVQGLWVKHVISNTPKGKNHTLKDRESEGATARFRNGKWGVRETCFEQWSLTRCSTDQVSIATEVANQEEKNADHLIPPLGLPTEYYPFKRCQVSMGYPVQMSSLYNRSWPLRL